MSVVELKKGAEPFAIGDVVHLRSGGAHMTVRSTTKKRDAVMVTVDWMDDADTICSAEFDARQLQSPDEKEAQGDG